MKRHRESLNPRLYTEQVVLPMRLRGSLHACPHTCSLPTFHLQGALLWGVRSVSENS